MVSDTENLQARKRGRPRTHDYAELDQLGREFGLKSRRSQQNHHYAALAYNILRLTAQERPDAREWIETFVDKVRPTVLSEVGRCTEADNPDVFWGAAQWAASNAEKLSVKRLAAGVRRMRLGGSSQDERVSRLYHAVLGTIDEHLGRYPETQTVEVLAALQMVKDLHDQA